jgi:hypothetical protein
LFVIINLYIYITLQGQLLPYLPLSPDFSSNWPQFVSTWSISSPWASLRACSGCTVSKLAMRPSAFSLSVCQFPPATRSLRTLLGHRKSTSPWRTGSGSALPRHKWLENSFSWK